MRSDLLTLVPEEAAWFLAMLETLERLATTLKRPTDPSVPVAKRMLNDYLASRAGSRVGATTRPGYGPVPHPDAQRFIGTEEAAEMLGITADAVRKACRSGRFCGVSRKTRGRWEVLASAVDTEVAKRVA